ncbi:MAG: S41 family peptidase [Sphingobium sp.]|nr:S41 family peptidase [Sphingobium sp.]MBP6110937.1 S41 family peptidase [Sphingobium sp.]MBP8670635.1 S41 family peptidase [Sphingobium sp.]MBP9156991.1 S41 family peptidase [Sphingobium sp.]MCC6481695.1 S41 family peptidase [Sphingomonadaceae bacterium]
MTSHFLRNAAAISALALIPAATAALAEADATNYAAIGEFMDVFQKVRSDYVDKVDDDKLIRGAIAGMLSSLDPHSDYLDESDYQNLAIKLEGSYGGLGLSVTTEEGAVKIIAPIEDTPGYRAGLKSGDYITHINGELIYDVSLDEAVSKMRGAAGTAIKLTIVRPGRDKPFDVDLVREKIDLKPVKWEVKDGVGIININEFSANTGADVRDAVRGIAKALGRKPTGYVLDLRSNPGGILGEAVGVSGVFLDGGEVVSDRGRNKADIRRYYADKFDDAGGAPVIVLIDGGSASASEIVAGALQDHHRALVMGERSFGKGSVQTVIPISETTGIKLTTSRYYTPSGRSIQEGGIKPDVRVPQLSDPDYKLRQPVRESDLRRHLLNEAKAADPTLEEDSKTDPRFAMTAEQLKAKGITDFQLTYAVQTIGRLGKAPVKGEKGMDALRKAAQ